MRPWGWVLLGAVGAALLVGGLWVRAAGEARLRADSANARLGRILEAAAHRATTAEQLLAGAQDSIGALEARLAAVPPPVLTPPPEPGAPDEAPRLRALLAERDTAIARQAAQLADVRRALPPIQLALAAAQDTIAALRRELADSIPPHPCPPPLEPPRLSGVALTASVLAWALPGVNAVAAVAELTVPVGRRSTATLFAGPGVSSGGAGLVGLGGRVSFRLAGR